MKKIIFIAAEGKVMEELAPENIGGLISRLTWADDNRIIIIDGEDAVIYRLKIERMVGGF